MFVAKSGFEDIFATVVAKKEALAVEKESAIKVFAEKLDAEFAVKEADLNTLFAQVSVEVQDEVAQPEVVAPVEDEATPVETAEEAPATVVEEVIAPVEVVAEPTPVVEATPAPVPASAPTFRQ